PKNTNFEPIPTGFFYHQASTHMIAAEGGCIVTKKQSSHILNLFPDHFPRLQNYLHAGSTRFL
ncbi:MAG: hypothetical protein SGI94_17605, partial [Saprospiraceae bacterium]|nr:hypothetical protein [Saprospiraceae bacterium]